jgi:hypothetical protein
MYSANRRLFEGDHINVYAEDLKRIERVIGNFGNVISFPLVLNFQKVISLKIADLLLGETPKITCGDSDSEQQKAVDTIVKNSDVFNISYEVAIDVSRYGDGLFLVRKKDGKGKIDITQPPIWFPIVDARNIKEVLYHVLAWEYSENDKDYLNVQIHSKGMYEERICSLNKNEITGTVSTQTFKTGFDDFAVIPVPNIITSDRVTGIDDYTDIDSIVSELMVRIGQVSRILDKHASPSMSGPQSSLEKDPQTGEWRLKAGNYFSRDTKEDPEVHYITWEGQLEASFKQIEKLINILYTISEMGSAVFGDMTSISSQGLSGFALKRLMMSPLAKVNRIRMRFDPALKKAIKLCSQLKGKDIIDLTNEEINIKWQDGLPADEKESAEIMQMRTGNKATISQLSAIQILDGKNDEEADAELQAILDDESATNPMIAPPLSTDNESEEVTEADIPQAVKQTLNGAQIASLLSIVQMVTEKRLTRIAAVNMAVETLGLTRAQAESFIEDNA